MAPDQPILEFYSLGVVVRVSETQLQVSENASHVM